MDFEAFTRERIRQLRAEADALQSTLDAYEAETPSGKTVRASPRGGVGTRGGFGIVLHAINAAGAEGLDTDAMAEAAAKEGYEINRGTLRSQLSVAKGRGDLEQIGVGRYRSSAFSPPSPERSLWEGDDSGAEG